MSGDVTHDGQTQAVRHELLNDRSGDARSEAEEIVVEPLRRNDDQARSVLPCLADQLDCVPLALELLAIRRALENLYAMQNV
jgi:hypothetical protein